MTHKVVLVRRIKEQIWDLKSINQPYYYGIVPRTTRPKGFFVRIGSHSIIVNGILLSKNCWQFLHQDDDFSTAELD
jgi:hypothetical protein